MKDPNRNLDIDNSSESETYYVWMVVTDGEGNILTVNALRGDIGYRIEGGKDKRIIWDPAADSVFLDTMLYIQVFADIRKGEYDFSRRGLMVQSVVFPGLGLSRISGNSHLIKGILGYGCLSGSIVFNRLAVSSYSDYEAADTPQEADDLLNSTISQQRVSQVLGFSAAAIWITDFVWTLVGTSHLKKDKHTANSRIRFGPDYDAHTRTPLLAFTYTF